MSFGKSVGDPGKLMRLYFKYGLTVLFTNLEKGMAKVSSIQDCWRLPQVTKKTKWEKNLLEFVGHQEYVNYSKLVNGNKKRNIIYFIVRICFYLFYHIT